MNPPLYPWTTPPAAGEKQEISPGVWWVRMPLPFALDHINLWLIRDGAGWAIVDTGIALPAVEAAWTRLLAELDGPVTRLIVTHFHPDHLGLAAWLQARTGAPLHITQGEFLTAHLIWAQGPGHSVADMIALFRAHGLDEAAIEAQAERGNAYRRGVPDLPATYERLHRGDALPLGERTWTVIEGLGHSPEHAALFAPSGPDGQPLLISGDMLLPRITTNISVFASAPNADALARYQTSLEELSTLPPNCLVLPSHGLPFRGLGERVAALHEHHEERLAVLESACAERPGQSAADLLPVLFPRRPDLPPMDAHQIMFAMGEALAHLNHLEHAGRLYRSQDADGVFRYSRSIP